MIGILVSFRDGPIFRCYVSFREGNHWLFDVCVICDNPLRLPTIFRMNLEHIHIMITILRSPR